MILPVFSLFAIVLVLFLAEKESTKPNPVILSFIFIAMIIICAFRSIQMPDAQSYISNFWYSYNVDSDRFEIGYQLVRDVVRSFSANYQVLFAVVAAIALTIKFRAIEVISPYMYGSLLVYMSNSFILHEMIQIRTGIAIGFALFAIKYIAERNFKRFLFFAVLATCFHYTSLCLFLLWFVPKIRINKWVWVSIIPFCYALVFKGLFASKLITLIPIAQVQILYNGYMLSTAMGRFGENHKFGLLFLGKVLICSFLILFHRLIETRYPHVRVWLMIYTIALALYVMLSDIPVVAARLSEFFQVAEIILIPLIVFTQKNKFVGKIIVMTIALIVLYITVFRFDYNL